MCLAVPARITELLPDALARADMGGVVKTISVALVDDLAVGDYVILHVGHALARLDPEEAAETLALIGAAVEAAEAAEATGADPKAPPGTVAQ